MRWLIGALLLPGCLIVAALLIQRTLRHWPGVLSSDRGRAQFHRRREWLEAEFLTTLGRIAPHERERWEQARWHDQVIWARDRKTGRLLALVDVHFPPDLPFEVDPEAETVGHATIVFEYHHGKWQTDGQRFDAIDAAETVQRRRDRYERLAGPEH